MRRIFPAALAATLWILSLAIVHGVTAGEPPSLIPGVEKEEKPKEKPFKYSAWCAFRELSSANRPPPKEDPLTEHTEPRSFQWDGFGRRGQWSTLVLELKNTTEKTDYRGTATIQLNPLKGNENFAAPYTTTYRQEFEIGPQTEKQFKFSVLCPEDGWNDQVMVNITANGRAFEPRAISLHDLDALKEEFVLVISESSGAFRFLQSSRKNFNDDPRVAERRVAVVEPAELPSRWHDLMMANLIVIDGPPREKLSDEQWAALKSYVQAGGHLLITAGKDPSRLKGRVEELAGITVREMTEVAGLDGGVTQDVNYPPPKPDFRLPLVDVSVSPKGSVEVRYSKAKIVEMSTRYYGPGSVTFLPFSLSDRLLENWEGRSIIPVEIINRGRDRGLFSNRSGYDEDLNPPPMVVATFPGTFQESAVMRTDSIVNLRHNLDESFSNDTPVQMQKPGTVMSFLLFYLLCAVPVNYFIFGWFRRREIAWLAVPFWAASFSILAYVVGYMGQTGQMTVNQVSVIEAGPGQDMGMARTFLGLYAPKRDDYRIEFPPIAIGKETSYELQAAPGHLLNVAQTETRNIENPELFLVDGDRGLSIERLRVQQRSTRRLEVVHRANIGDGLDLAVKRQGSNLDINVQNNTGFALHLPVLIEEGRAFELGSAQGAVLQPGEAKSFQGVRPADSMLEAFFSKTIYFKSARGTHAQKRARALNEYVQKQIEKYARAERAIFCAWIDNEMGALPLKVAGSGQPLERPRIEGVTLLIVPVRVKEDFTVSDVPQRARVTYTQDFTPANGQVRWTDIPNAQLQMKRDPLLPPQLPPASVAYLSIELPKKHRELRSRGYQLKLWFNLDAASLQMMNIRGRKGPEKPNLDGELKIEYSRLNDLGRTEWAELESPPVIGLKPGNTVTVGPVMVPMTNYRAITNDTIQLRIVFTPNQALANIIANYTLYMKNIECKTGRANRPD